MARRSRRVCRVCGGPIRSDTVYGICQRNPGCQNEWRREQAETLRTRLRAKGKTERGELILYCRMGCGTPVTKTSFDGLCTGITQQCLRERNKVKKTRSREKHLLGRYGITPEEYRKLYDAQGGKCFICQKATGMTRKLAVDHDHKIGEGKREAIRGLLCDTCNKILGIAEDKPDLFLRAIDYLRHPPARKVLK